MLNIHILNVGQGDSIILEYSNEDGTSYGLIDSYVVGNEEPKALEVLRKLGAEKLSFIALTHPHNDHYKGLPDIIRDYKHNIENFYSYPFGAELNNESIKKVAKIYRKVASSTDSKTLQQRSKDFINLLVCIKKFIGIDKWESYASYESYLAPVGFKGVSISVISPPPKVKGPYVEMIMKDDRSIAVEKKPNELSLAFSIKYEGHEVILGGDTPSDIWLGHKEYCRKRGTHINADFVKLPHHGSKADNTKVVLEHLFSGEGERVACISANGRKHPSLKTLQLLKEMGVSPVCTNFSKHCGNNVIALDRALDDIEPRLRRFVRTMKDEEKTLYTQPCKGNITISISDKGVELKTENNIHCFNDNLAMAELFPIGL